MVADDGERRRRGVARAVALIEARPERLVCIVGPTASGKTDIAIETCERIGGEIVSADSIQIYRGFDIGSGKPSRDECDRAPHHVIDVLLPNEAVDAVRYATLAERAIEDVRARGKIPVLCGGTFFWVRALVLGLVDAPAADEAIRARHRAQVEAEGRASLHAALAKVDPRSAARLHPNDVVRVSRALEIFELSGRTMSDWHEEHGFRGRRMDAVLLAPGTTPEELTSRIRARAARWLADGWLEEVERLVAEGWGESRPMGSVGYAEVRAHLRGELSREMLLDAIVQSTRIFTRRQRTWLKSADVEWL
ncbi:MAG: tRNA (adenosine(37)-N6)-dimethylallyltransferase MiaA [Deltaproteobacteria bacterium]|nr:tRNA (adenosine(37)-N6)-dimethylallyltransferase MiaA [Deltaproteobacteria bacterium]